MNLRPVQASWFELLTTHDELTDTLAALAQTGAIELELSEHTQMEIDLQDLQSRMQEFARIERRYVSQWPAPDAGMSPFSGSPGEILDKALSCLVEWERKAQPKMQRLEVISSRLNDIRLLLDFLAGDGAPGLDYRLLAMPGAGIVARLYLVPGKSRLESVPPTVLWKRYTTSSHDYLLLVGAAGDLDALSAELAIKKHTRIQMPSLPPGKGDALRVIAERQARLETHAARLRAEIDELAGPYHLAQALGEIGRMKWFLSNVSTLPASDNFAWITGWTSDSSGAELNNALALCSSHAILHYPPVPDGKQPPLMLRNPWWARPFELFARMLGTPGRDEADPSRLLSVIAPLLFGYMFGDVGQGFVLLLAGVVLQKRWPVLRILVANGASAMLFGLLFGSMFGREDLIPALWLHPIVDPLPVLAVPIFAGILIIVTGMALNAAEAYWRGDWSRWLHTGAPVIMLYLGLISILFVEGDTSLFFIMTALAWYLAGSAMLAGGSLLRVLVSLGSLVETVLQLVLNTISFVRVGAFALAHAGLSLAFNIMADSTTSMLAAALILLLGNVIVTVLEGLIVSIQTTRLILFEFFIRFLQANGRSFRPLAAPAAKTSGV